MTPAIAETWPLVGRRVLLEQGTAMLDAPDQRGVLLHGEAGVGKTRLANEIVAVAERQDLVVARAVASRAATALPLGALAHLLPAELLAPAGGGGVPDAVRVFDATRTALRALGGSDRPIVLFVDDLHLLDPSSATLVAQLVVEGEIKLIGTVRTDDPVPAHVSSLWRDHRVIRLDLENLPRQNVETLLHLALGGPLEGAALRSVWEASRGNLLYLHELIVAAVSRGDLVNQDGVWQLCRPLSASPHLIEVIGARIDALAPDARRVTELLSLCQPLSLADLEAVAPIDVLEGLERDGLIVVVDRRRADVALAHPLHGEVLRAQLPATRRRALLREQIARVEDHGMRRRDDARRVAAWRLDADGTADPALLVQAATLARHAHDLPAVTRLAAAALESEPSPQASILLGEAHYELGSFDDAEAVLAEAATTLPADDEVVVAHTVIRTKNLFWGLLDVDRALEVSRANRRLVHGPDGLAALVVEEAGLLMFSGRPNRAFELLDAREPPTDPRSRVIHAIAWSPTLSAHGQTARAIAVAEAGFEEHMALGEQIAIAHPGTHIVNQVFALTDAGRLDEAAQLATAGYDITVADGSLIAQIWFALNLGRINLLAGRPATARRWHREGVAVARATGFVGPLHLALAGAAAASGLLGEPDAARAAITELDALPGFGFLAPELAIGRAWSAVADGDLGRARAVLADAADVAAATGHVVSESWLRHDLARLGAAGTVVDRLAALAAGSDSDLLARRAEHARALATGGAEDLTTAAEHLEAAGLLLAAAEAATAAADGWKRDGQPRRASSSSEQAAQLLARCEGARTPGTVMAESVVPLSKREREVAILAAGNVPSKEIAERLYLSVRTVNNHLQRIYTKLGVSSRAGLAEALDRRHDSDEGGSAA
jgi:DNA-binding CsgD family transcriptional regulator/tetratricopeptide (TPR) repeat protein